MESLPIYLEDLWEGAKNILIEILSLQSKVKKRYQWVRLLSWEYEMTWEFRAPKKWEFYLSGANPLAYEAFNDLDTEYNICVKI